VVDKDGTALSVAFARSFGADNRGICDWNTRLVGDATNQITFEWTNTILRDPSHPLVPAFEDIALENSAHRFRLTPL